MDMLGVGEIASGADGTSEKIIITETIYLVFDEGDIVLPFPVGTLVKCLFLVVYLDETSKSFSPPTPT